MRRTIEEFISECDACQRGKGDHELTAPLGCLGEPQAPFEMVSTDITGPYPVTARKNRYLLTFVDHFSKYAEVHLIQDQSAETCAKVFATQVVARHGSGYKLITDQGAAFMSTFFSETCRTLGVRRSRTSGYHPMSNGHVEHLHRTLHTALSHYVNQTHTDWDLRAAFFYGVPFHATPPRVTVPSVSYTVGRW
jgi:transposase InsO family protein